MIMTTSYSFKNNITIDNDKYLQWLDSLGNRTQTITLDANNNLVLNRHPSGTVSINPGNVGAVFMGGKVAIGLGNTLTNPPVLNASVTVPAGGYIGTSNSSGNLGLSGSGEMDGTKSARALLYGNGDNNGASMGNFSLYAGNTNTSSILFYTKEQLKMRITQDNIEIRPNGVNNRMTINNETTEILNELLLTSNLAATGLNTGTLRVAGGMSIAGDLYVGGAITNYSDIRLKRNIQPILPPHGYNSTCEFVENLNTVKFNYQDDAAEEDHIGFIAQDFVHAFPELLRKPDTEHYSLDYSKLTVLLVQCIRELRQEIQELKGGRLGG